MIARALCKYSVCLQAPSGTIVVKGLSQKTTEEDLYQILVFLLSLLVLTSLYL